MAQQEAAAPMPPPVQKAVRKSRAEEQAAFMRANNIKFKDVVPVQYKAVILSAETAKLLNPALAGKSVEELNAGDEEKLTMYRLCQRPGGATVQSREYSYDMETTTFLGMESLKPAFLFEGEAAVHNAFLNGGPNTCPPRPFERCPSSTEPTRAALGLNLPLYKPGTRAGGRPCVLGSSPSSSAAASAAATSSAERAFLRGGSSWLTAEAGVSRPLTHLSSTSRRTLGAMRRADCSGGTAGVPGATCAPVKLTTIL